MDYYFQLAYGSILLLLGIMLLFISTKSYWKWIYLKSLEVNPYTKFSRERFPVWHNLSITWGRVFMLIVGLFIAVLGGAIVLAVLITNG